MSLNHSFETRTGPTGRPGPGTGPGPSKNPPGSWPGETRATRVNPAETRSFFYIYTQMWNYVVLTYYFFIHELLDATMKVMKLVVASCSVESQNKIIDKAYTVLSSNTFLSTKDSLSSLQAQLEAQLEELEDTRNGQIFQ